MSKKILFIEDESALQKIIGESLKEKGYEMLSASDGETGLKLAQQEMPDLVLLDLILPKLPGMEVLKRLKEDEKTKNLPVIVLTNLEDMKIIEEAISLGAISYLVKANYSIEEVLQKIETVLKEG